MQMKSLIFIVLFFFSSQFIVGQNIGIGYYGELGFRPGVQVDYGLSILKKEIPKEEKKRYFSHQLNLRPALAYFRYAHNSNNYLLSANFNYQLQWVNKTNQRYLFVEPVISIGILRKAYIGEIFQTTGDGFDEKIGAGTTSFTVGGGLNLGGYISKRFDWVLGMDYFIENTEDKLVLHRFVVKLGIRIKFIKK